jgi:hypothetical protein
MFHYLTSLPTVDAVKSGWTTFPRNFLVADGVLRRVGG